VQISWHSLACHGQRLYELTCKVCVLGKQQTERHTLLVSSTTRAAHPAVRMGMWDWCLNRMCVCMRACVCVCVRKCVFVMVNCISKKNYALVC